MRSIQTQRKPGDADDGCQYLTRLSLFGPELREKQVVSEALQKQRRIFYRIFLRGDSKGFNPFPAVRKRKLG
jgi:hypothetical protein